MFGFNKKTVVTTTRETEQLTSGVEIWMVQWTKRYGPYSGDTRKAFQAFTNYEEAVKFQGSLKQAFKLIGNTYEDDVRLYKQENGL